MCQDMVNNERHDEDRIDLYRVFNYCLSYGVI